MNTANVWQDPDVSKELFTIGHWMNIVFDPRTMNIATLVVVTPSISP